MGRQLQNSEVRVVEAHGRTPEGALAIGRLAEERGADVVNIVQLCGDDDDVAEALASTVRLKRELRIPFVTMAMGEYGNLVRTMAPLPGAMVVFARRNYEPGNFLDQLPVRAMRALLADVDLRISRRAVVSPTGGALAPGRITGRATVDVTARVHRLPALPAAINMPVVAKSHGLVVAAAVDVLFMHSHA